jgi:peptidoglycan-N-acetylglucosamine deacetylase
MVVGVWLLTQTDETALRYALVTWIVLGAVVAVRPMAVSLGACALVGVLALGSWIGANSPELTWFGHQVSHGPRSTNEVAITFDDGPDVTATLAIARILDEHGAKGAFFEVGKAIARRPDITQALIDDDQLVGNHSYRHDSTHWLDPWYRELGATQHTFASTVGVCPAFYRAPHGQHTPFVAHVVADHHMTMIGWDSSAGDWAHIQPQTIANRVLRKVRGGSIIDLHDGLDGDVNADRTNLVRAMPLILDGLQAKGLQPVRLDVLLGKKGYLANCGSRRPVQTRPAASGMAPKSMTASR